MRHQSLVITLYGGGEGERGKVWGGGREGEGLGGTHGFQGKRRVLGDQSSPTEY